jgi:hypothetical protein
MQALDRDGALATGALHEHRGVQRDERDGEIAGIHGDALGTAAERSR